jgi:hypothetical protein
MPDSSAPPGDMPTRVAVLEEIARNTSVALQEIRADVRELRQQTHRVYRLSIPPTSEAVPTGLKRQITTLAKQDEPRIVRLNVVQEPWEPKMVTLRPQKPNG